jgi:murein L,D-transpeptidase YcbB/YkuD
LSAKDFMTAILDVQPKSKAYADLQKYMTLIRGQYLDDCYTVPEGEIRKVAINIERLKWNVVTSKTYIEVNIPSYTLTYYLPDTSFTFKVIVGKPERPTPVIKSAISYIGTAPDWKVPQQMFTGEILSKALVDPSFLENRHYTIYDQNGKLVSTNQAILEKIKKNPKGYSARQSSGCELTLGRIAFHFPNENGIYLYDGQQEELFMMSNRPFSNSCVSVQQADRLAELMLRYDGQVLFVPEMYTAANAYKSRNFILNKPVILSIIYQTCVIKNGLPIFYPDPYAKDKELEKDIYRHDVMLAKN